VPTAYLRTIRTKLDQKLLDILKPIVQFEKLVMGISISQRSGRSFVSNFVQSNADRKSIVCTDHRKVHPKPAANTEKFRSHVECVRDRCGLIMNRQRVERQHKSRRNKQNHICQVRQSVLIYANISMLLVQPLQGNTRFSANVNDPIVPGLILN
jgi:hypothetical protein